MKLSMLLAACIKIDLLHSGHLSSHVNSSVRKLIVDSSHNSEHCFATEIVYFLINGVNIVFRGLLFKSQKKVFFRKILSTSLSGSENVKLFL